MIVKDGFFRLMFRASEDSKLIDFEIPEKDLDKLVETLLKAQSDHNKKAYSFYHQGKFFKKEEDFWKDVNEWPFRVTDEKTFKRLWETLGKDVWANIRIEVTNGAMNDVLQENFLVIMQKFWGKNERTT